MAAVCVCGHPRTCHHADRGVCGGWRTLIDPRTPFTRRIPCLCPFFERGREC